MKIVAEVVGVSRSNLIERMRERAKKRIGRPPLPHDKLVAEIKAVIAELPTYGYRRVHATRPSPPSRSYPARLQRTRSIIPETRQFRHDVPRLSSISRCLGPTQS